MEIDKVSVLLVGVCQSVVAVGDMVKVESSASQFPNPSLDVRLFWN